MLTLVGSHLSALNRPALKDDGEVQRRVPETVHLANVGAALDQEARDGNVAAPILGSWEVVHVCRTARRSTMSDRHMI